MKNTIRAGIALASLVASSVALATPAVGDLGFVAVNADEDGFALTTFVDLAAGDQFYFTDKKWNGGALGAGGAFDPGEGVLEWTLDAGVAAGSVVRFASVNSASSLWVSQGVLSRSGSFSLAVENDSVTVYLDQSGDVLPLAAIGYGKDFETQMAGAGLDGALVSFTGRVDYAEYVGIRSGESSFDAYAPLVTDAGQWMVRESTVETNTVPYLGAFSVTAPVPEPESYALMLAGLGLVGGMVRRRRGMF